MNDPCDPQATQDAEPYEPPAVEELPTGDQPSVTTAMLQTF